MRREIIRARVDHAAPDYSVFKYLERKYAQELAHEGKLLLRPLTYYQRCDAADSARRRDREGQLDRSSSVQRASLDDILRNRPFEASMIGANETNKNIVFDRSTFTKRVECGEYWGFCVSRESSLRLRTEFKVDASVHIPRPSLFFQAIWKALGAECVGSIWGRCVYIGRDVDAYDVTQDVIACFAKEIEDEHQDEVRALFQARPGLTPNEITLEVPALIALCELLE